MRLPLFVIGLTYFLALMLASSFGFKASLVMTVVFAGLSILSIIAKNPINSRIFTCVFMAAAIASSAFAVYTYLFVMPVSVLENKDASISGTLVELPEETNGKYYYTVETDSVLLEGVPQRIKIRVSVSNALDINPFERINCKVHFYPASGEGNSFNSRNYYNSKGIYMQAFLYEYEHYSIAPRTSSPPYYHAIKMREKIMNSVDYMLPQEEASLINAVALGQRQYLDEDIKENFSIDGISHVLAVSGLHISILSSAFMALLLRCKVPRRLAAGLSIFMVIAFMAVTGFVPSVMRAGIMAVIMYVGIMFVRRADPLNSLGAAVLILCAVNPLAAGDIGLVLSFFATMGIIILPSKIHTYIGMPGNALDGRLQKPLNNINKVFSTALSAMLFTLPFTLISFGEISLIAPVANLLLVFPISVMMLLGVAASLLSMLGVTFLAMPFAFLAKLLADYAIFVSDFLAKLPFASINTSESFVILVVSGIIILVAVAVYLGGERLYRFCAILSALVLLTGIASYQLTVLKDTTKVSVLNTGNGCAVLLSGDNANALISCGGSNRAQYNVDRFLRSSRVKNLDFMLVPDASNNSAKAAGAVIGKYKPQGVLLNEDCKSEETIMRDLDLDTADFFYKRAYAEIFCDTKIEIITNDEKSFLACEVGGKSFIICPNGGDVYKIPPQWRSCNFFIVGKLPRHADLIDCDYLVISMDDSERTNSLKRTMPIADNILSTSEAGNINVCVKGEKISISRE